MKANIRNKASRLADALGLPVLTDGKYFFIIKQNPSLFQTYKLAPAELIQIHDDFIKKKISFKEYKRREKQFVKDFYSKKKVKKNPLLQDNCKCKGVDLLLDMTELYKWLGDKKFKSNQLDREKALRITDSLLKTVSEKDVYSTDNAGLWKSFLREAKYLNNECKEGLGEQCIYALENMRAVIHGDWGIRAKILCETEEQRRPPFSKENEEVLKSMYALRGAFYGTPVDAVNKLKALKENLGCDEK